MQNNFKPDLGLLLAEQFGKEPRHQFYSVQINYIIHVGNNLYTTMAETQINGAEYAISFDFDEKTLLSLILQINDEDLQSYIKSILLKDFTGPEKALFQENPITVDISGKLGELVHGKYETFIPLVVEEFTNLKT